METLITKHREGFGPGYTAITRAGEPGDDTGISMGVLRLARRASRTSRRSRGETAFLLMEGRVSGQVGGLGFDLARRSLFDDSPACLHAPAGAPVEIRASDGLGADGLRLRQPGDLHAARVPAGRRRRRAPRRRPGRRTLPAARAHDLRRAQFAARGRASCSARS